MPSVLQQLEDLKTGKIKAISLGLHKGFGPDSDKSNPFAGMGLYTTMDLGTSTESIGYDHNNDMFYISIVDIWDFNKSMGGGSYEKWGEVSPNVEGVGEGIQMYGRVYISEQEFLDNILVMDDDNVTRLSQMPQEEKK